MGLKGVEFYYFSGTGNTLLVVRRMRDVFRKSGIDVATHRIEASDPAAAGTGGTLGLAFPVAAQSTYKFVWDFIRALPEGRGAEVFMVDTLAGFSGALVGPLKKFLRGRGYRPTGAREIRMPSNWFPGRIDAEKARAKIARAMAEADRYALDLVEGRARWGRVAVISDVLLSLVGGDWTWKFLSGLGKRFEVRGERCTRCGLCARLCPVGNIEMRGLPSFLGKCQQCMKCIASCPVEAIFVPGKKYEIYRAVSAGELAAEAGRGGG